MKYLSILLAVCFMIGCKDYYKIDQNVRACNGPDKFQVYTFVFRHGWGISSNIYSSRTWKGSDNDCIPADSVKAVKKREYELAEQFLELYKKTQ